MLQCGCLLDWGTQAVSGSKVKRRGLSRMSALVCLSACLNCSSETRWVACLLRVNVQNHSLPIIIASCATCSCMSTICLKPKLRELRSCNFRIKTIARRITKAEFQVKRYQSKATVSAATLPSFSFLSPLSLSLTGSPQINAKSNANFCVLLFMPHFVYFPFLRLPKIN